MYRNDAYRKIRTFSQSYKTQYGLYKHTRGCYSPAGRIAGFFRTHLQGGALDGAAGDGSLIPSALPIETTDARIRPALSRLWWDSNLTVKRGVLNLWGTIFGDVALSVRDEPDLGMVSLDVIHPGTLKWLDCDARGEVTAYVRQETRYDPRGTSPTAGPNAIRTARQVLFTEIVELDGGNVHYRQYLDGMLYPWNGASPEWDAPYGFIPLFPVRHIDTGMGWGESEFEAGRAKIDEVNDLGSKLHDQIRRMVEGAWAIGASKPKTDRSTFTPTESSRTDPEADRSDQKFLWLGNQTAPVSIQSLVGDLDIAATSAEIRQTLDSLEDDYPELRFERLSTGGRGFRRGPADGASARRCESRRATTSLRLRADAGADGGPGHRRLARVRRI
jgi:hypothetical protein